MCCFPIAVFSILGLLCSSESGERTEDALLSIDVLRDKEKEKACIDATEQFSFGEEQDRIINGSVIVDSCHCDLQQFFSDDKSSDFSCLSSYDCSRISNMINSRRCCFLFQ